MSRLKMPYQALHEVLSYVLNNERKHFEETYSIDTEEYTIEELLKYCDEDGTIEHIYLDCLIVIDDLKPDQIELLEGQK